MGYLTNALAIRMLFRPFKPHWYTLGWQGIIPRTRNALAHNVARVVGEKLVTAEEIDKTLFQPQLQENLRNIIAQTMECWRAGEDRAKTAEKINVLLDSALLPALEALLADPEARSLIDGSINGIAKGVWNKIRGMSRGEAASYLKPLSGFDNSALRGRLALLAEKTIREQIHNFIYSGKSIKDIAGGEPDSGKIAGLLVTQINPVIRELFADETFAKAVGKMIVDYKNEQFDHGVVDRMKLGAVNVFFYDDKIYELVREKLPEAGDKISGDEKIQAGMRLAVGKKIDAFLTAPLGSIVDMTGTDRYYGLLHKASSYIAGRLLPEDAGTKILEFIKGSGYDSARTLGEFLDAGGGVSPAWEPDIRISGGMDAGVIVMKLKEFLNGAVSSGSGLSGGQINSIAGALSGWVLRILHTALPKFLQLVNITSLVEQKINALDMKEVEDMLFSFMKNHFKWINILGFIIGFIVGCGQAGFILMTGR